MEENKEIKKEEVKKDNKKKIPMYVYIVGIVVVLLLILIISLVVMVNSGDDEVVEEPPKVEEPVTPPSINSLTETDAKKIYEETLPFIKNYVGASIHHIDRMTVINTNTNFLRSFAFTKIKFKEGDLLPYINDDGTLKCVGETCTLTALLNDGWYRFSPTLLQEQAKYYYGTEIPNGDFSDEIIANVMYIDDMYARSIASNERILSYHHNEYVSYEVVGDTLFVTDKYLYIYGELDERKENFNVTVYGDSSKKTKIGSGVYLDAGNLIEFIIPTYERKKVSYKHEFKQAADGHWYWISSEQVK